MKRRPPTEETWHEARIALALKAKFPQARYKEVARAAMESNHPGRILEAFRAGRERAAELPIHTLLRRMRELRARRAPRGQHGGQKLASEALAVGWDAAPERGYQRAEALLQELLRARK